jgi:hypothetical protein
MQARRFGERVLETHVEVVAFVEHQAERARRLDDAEASRGLAADLDLAGLQAQDLLLAGGADERRNRRRERGADDHRAAGQGHERRVA